MTDLNRAACIIWLLQLEEAIAPIPRGEKSSNFQRLAYGHLCVARKVLDRGGEPPVTNLECAHHYLSYLVPELPAFRND